MNMLQIYIDGACKNNGKPECISSGGIFCMYTNSDGHMFNFNAFSVYESHNSSNQRGELNAFYHALWTFKNLNEPSCNIVTDSEYIFSTVRREWYKSWEANSWMSKQGTTIKNLDLWQSCVAILNELDAIGKEINMVFIKGHAISIGKVTSLNALQLDSTGELLFNKVLIRFDLVGLKPELYSTTQQLSLNNNGYEFTDEQLRIIVAGNIVADTVATRCLQHVSALM